jgi:hypothetical protein
MRSIWCAWCGERVAGGVIVGKVVAYHDLCWARRARVLAGPERIRRIPLDKEKAPVRLTRRPGARPLREGDEFER